ncbi:MAG: hypothetical protein ACM3XS_06885, partial [Bacteroidota bacterium]
MRALDSLRLRSIRARLLLWYVGVSVLAVAAMGAAAFKLSGQRTERWACSVAEAAVTRAADEVAGRVATCERLSMLLFTDNDLQRYLGMAAVAPQDAWRTYYDFTRRLDTIKRYYPEAYQLTIYVNAP